MRQGRGKVLSFYFKSPVPQLARTLTSCSSLRFFLFLILLLSQHYLAVNVIAQSPTKRVLILSGYENRPTFSLLSFWTLYKWYVLGMVAVFIIEAVLIAYLLFTRRRRRYAEGESKRLATIADSEHRHLDQIVSNVPGVVWESRIDSSTGTRKTTFVSDYVEKMLGYRAADWLSKPDLWLQLVHEGDRERVRRETEALLAGREGGAIRFRWLAKDGHIVWVATHLAPIVDQEGKIIGVRGVTLDMTDQKLAEEAQRRSEERFGKAFRANPQPMSLTTIAGGLYLDVNESFLTMSGYKREEVIGHTSLELNIWQTPDVRAAFIRKLKDEGSISNLETKFRTKSGSFRVLLSSAERLEIAGEDCLLVASSDITERVEAERALQESEQRFRNMADTAPVMIWVAGEEKQCTYVNKRWVDFTGRSSELELGTGWLEGIHPDDHSRCLEMFTSNFDQRTPFELEYRLRRKDGAYRWIFDSATPRFSADGKFLGYIGSCIDITERKESEVALQKAHAELGEMKNKLEAENIYLQQELQQDLTFGEIIGQSDAIKYVLFKITQVAPTDSTVLITGETGTGKELVARAIHAVSSRKDQPLIRVNCAALSPNLIESEFFGHEKGAFTGAVTRELGRFELANGGTIFLDEIGELPTELQVKLLRVIQEGEIERLGGTKTIPVDVRIIAATNRNLKLEVEKGDFREDLWYRLNVFPITVPPLRQRKEDIPLLVEHFVSKSAKRFGKKVTSISPAAMHSLRLHSWPGNVRELANAIERAVIYTQGEVLNVVDRFEPPEEPLASLPKTLEEVEREYIIRTLESTGWRIEGQYGAAKILGMNPSTLRTRMLKLAIERVRSTYV